MKSEDRQSEVLARVKQSNSFHLARNSGDTGEMLSRYTMFTLGIAAFSAGFWAMACLSKMMFEEGPLSLLKQLAATLIGK